MCFEETLLISKEFGTLQLEKVPTESSYSMNVWHTSFPMGEILFNEIKENQYCIWYFEYLIKGNTTITIQNTKCSSIALSFTLKKNQHYQVNNLRNGVAKRNHYNLTYLPQVDCDFIFTKGEYASFGIEFSEEYLRSLGSNDSDLFSEFIQNIIERKPATITTHHHPATAAIMDIVTELIQFRIPGKMRRLYIKSKVVDLLRLSIDNMLAGSNRSSNEVSASDERLLQNVMDYLMQNLDNPGTLPEIAYRCGINEYKLKQGFKALFHKSVIAFVHEERLKRAKARINEGLLPLKRIATEAGYKNISNFTTAFKKLFGYPPGLLKRNTFDKE